MELRNKNWNESEGSEQYERDVQGGMNRENKTLGI